MDSKPEKPLRLFVNPFMAWNELALKTGQAMLASAHAAALRARTHVKVAVIPPVDAPAPESPKPRGKAAKPRVTGSAKRRRRR